MVLQMAGSPLLRPNNIPFCVPQFIHLSVIGYFGRFRILTSVNHGFLDYRVVLFLVVFFKFFHTVFHLEYNPLKYEPCILKGLK